ncbi:MAG: MBL fold metallo-hydrolase [Burkholderiales bacterium]|nr:MAG: MBL fold metallo-hydrolase [Burkholderiales bacterium]
MPADLFAVPDVVKKANNPTPPSYVALQWMIRRAHWGSFLDSDALAFDPAVVPSLKWTEVKPGVFHITGGSHHTMVIEMKDYLIAIDAPVGNEMSRMTMAEAKKRFPNKPFKFVLMTHHHMDHAAGTRVFAAAGATVIYGAGNKKFFNEQLTAPNRVRNDELWANPRTVDMLEVADSHKITDGVRDVMIYMVPNTHSANTLILTLPKDDFGWVTDLWSPSRDRPNDRPSHFEFINEVRRRNIVMTTWAGGHGNGVAPIQPLLNELDKIRSAAPARVAAN